MSKQGRGGGGLDSCSAKEGYFFARVSLFVCPSAGLFKSDERICMLLLSDECIREQSITFWE